MSLTASTALADRFAAASGRLPLASLHPTTARELDAVLSTATAFDELPGKWQAALLAAEGAEAPAPPSGRCCGHGA